MEEEVDDFSYDLSVPHISRTTINNLIGTKLLDLFFYRQAFVHDSMTPIIENRINNGIKVCDYMKESNERLEFLGDSIYNMIVTEYLYKKYFDKDEGFLTRIRIKMVRSDKCIEFARVLGLDKYILTANKVINSKTKIHVNSKAVEDCFEAFIGALYTDLGFSYTKVFIINLINTYVNFDDILVDDNYKDIIMRYCHMNNYPLPVYETEKVIKNFVTTIYINKNEGLQKLGTGTGTTKKESEKQAAKCACDTIDVSLKHIISRDQ